MAGDLAGLRRQPSSDCFRLLRVLSNACQTLGGKALCNPAPPSLQRKAERALRSPPASSSQAFVHYQTAAKDLKNCYFLRRSPFWNIPLPAHSPSRWLLSRAGICCCCDLPGDPSEKRCFQIFQQMLHDLTLSQSLPGARSQVTTGPTQQFANGE